MCLGIWFGCGIREALTDTHESLVDNIHISISPKPSDCYYTSDSGSAKLAVPQSSTDVVQGRFYCLVLHLHTPVVPT